MNKKIKIGSGFDAHRFTEASDGHGSIMLGGVPVSCRYNVIAHSDGDVLLHALTDAILGAIGEGDIGVHFPPTDSKWKGTSSGRFVKFAINLMEQKGGSINNIDITIISETPKMAPHRDAIISSISSITGVAASDINLKATTTEKMGFTGREEGIACQASILIQF